MRVVLRRLRRFSALVNRLAPGGALPRPHSSSMTRWVLTMLYWITRGGGEISHQSMRLSSGAGGMGTLGADVDGRGGESADGGE